MSEVRLLSTLGWQEAHRCSTSAVPPVRGILRGRSFCGWTAVASAMEDADGSLSFDFEGGLENVAASNNVGLGGTTGLAPSLAPLPAGAGHQAASVQAPGGLLSGPSKAPQGRKNYRQTVCRHWLRGLCMKGDACGFLHQYDKSRMPVCRFFAKFGECREPDCIYKHTNEDIKECNM